ncbi:MAG: outer membrane protein assembly factor BamD [Candidatus Cloacimonetes bacterium]|nr:outer membrane protein assembly factor BamD [Candidatus Cloacimonadota bacterium]
MKQIRNLTILLLLLALLGACSQASKMQRMSVDEKMARGNEFYELEKWRKAIPYFQEVVFERKTAYTDDAQRKLADCYFFMENWVDARYEYQELIRLFPDYEDIGTAYFSIGLCYFEESLNYHYTQDETYESMDAFSTFLERFPGDERAAEAQDYLVQARYKLLEKAYMNGYIYWRINDYSAALLYFDDVRAAGLDDEIDRKAIYYSARIYLEREDMGAAHPIIVELKERYPESAEARRLEKHLEQ